MVAILILATTTENEVAPALGVNVFPEIVPPTGALKVAAANVPAPPALF